MKIRFRSVQGRAAAAGVLTVASLLSACMSDESATSVPPVTSASTPATPIGPTQCNPPSPASGMPQVSASDSHYFAIDGQTWFPAGYYGGAFSVTEGPAGSGFGVFQAYNHEWLDQLASNRLNYARLWSGYDSLGIDGAVMHPYAVVGGGKVDLDQWNPEYFSLLADTVQYARNRSVALQLILIHCGTVDYDGGAYQSSNYYHASRNVNGVGFANSAQWFQTSGPVWERHKRFVNKVLDTIGSQPNLTYEICNEKFVTGSPSEATFEQTRNDPFIKAVYDLIRARGDQHVIVGSDIPEHRSLPGFFVPNYSGDPNVLNTSADIGGMHGDLVGRFGANVPLVTDNDCCNGQPSADAARQKVWAALTAGAHTDYFNNEMYGPNVLRNQNTRDGMRWIGYARKFIEERCIQLAGMHPADGAATNGWTLARDGIEYIVYLGNGGTTTINALPASYEAIWFNPRDGSTQNASGPNFTAPSGGDWILHVRGMTGPTSVDTDPVDTKPGEAMAGACNEVPVNGFRAQYFGNPNLTNPVLTRCESGIDVRLDPAQAPTAGVPADFSTRWEGDWDFAGGMTTFDVRTDDGMRLWVDGTLVIDQWKIQAEAVYSGAINLAAGRHRIKVEYYDERGFAVANVAWH